MRQFDFAALAVRGPKCWIAGTPGTRVFPHADAGPTWTASVTGSTAPLQAIAFADDQHGWAAGDLGAIWPRPTADRPGKRQRAGNTRAALLGIFAEPEEVPLELIARLSPAKDTFRWSTCWAAATSRLCPRLRPPGRSAARGGGPRGAAGRGGVAVPLRQAGLRLPARQIVEAWDRRSDGHGMEELQAIWCGRFGSGSPT